ncbi:hypothetical protein D3C76_357190 [compost metagenome]
MADWFIATEGVKVVKVVKDSASLWPQIITALASIGAALGGVSLTHHYTRKREERIAEAKRESEHRFIATELAFRLERYALGWASLGPHVLNASLENGKIPALDLSDISGDWRAFPANRLFRIRSLEAYQAALNSRIHREPFLERPDIRYSLKLECFQTGVKAFLLAARLRRDAGLPDSLQLKGSDGTFQILLKRRNRFWGLAVANRRKKKQDEVEWKLFTGQGEHGNTDDV